MWLLLDFSVLVICQHPTMEEMVLVFFLPLSLPIFPILFPPNIIIL